MTNGVERWVLLTGSRTVLTALLIGGTVALTALLVEAGVVYVGAGSNLASALSSGLLSGLLTLITVTLSINQLILSRVFGPPSRLSQTMRENIEFRERIEDIADVPVSPNEPSEFLGLLGETLVGHADRLRTRLNEERLLSEESEQFTDHIEGYGEHIGGAGETDDPFTVLMLTLGTGYAERIKQTRRLKAVAPDLPGDVETLLDETQTLLEGIATMRQFFKTMTIQQDLARLSRQIIYTGLAAVLTTYYLSQVYTSSPSLPTAIPQAYMPAVTSLAAGVIFSPLLVIIAYVLRVATVALYTVSVGTFTPPVVSVKEQ